MVTFPRDNRFPEPGVDARFSTPGVDWRFSSPPADNRFPSPGIDRRWMGDPWNYTAPGLITAATLTPATAVAGYEFTVNVGAAGGTPTPTATVVVKLDDVVLAPVGGVYVPATAGVLTAEVIWSNGVDPDLVQNLSAEVTSAGTAPTVITEPKWLAETVHAGSVFTADIGSAAGDPAPTSTYYATFDNVFLEPLSPGVWQSPSSGIMRLHVTWSNGIAPDLVLVHAQEVW